MTGARQLLGAALAIAALAGGCGGSEREEERVRAAILDVYIAFVKGDGPGVCDGFTTELVDELNAQIEANYPEVGDRTCPEAIELLVPEGAAQLVDEARSKAEVTDVDVDGDRATARIGSVEQSGPGDRIELTKVGDDWLISDPGEELTPAAPSDGATRESVSKPEAIDRADEFCRETRAALVALGRPPTYAQLARARPYEQRSAEIEREPLLALEALLPPSRDRRLYDEFVASLRLSRELGLEAIEHLEAGRATVADTFGSAKP